MAQFFTQCGTGATATTEPADTSKVKVYNTYANAVSCISCLAEGEIVATKSGNPLDMDAVKDYIADQNRLYPPVEVASNCFPYVVPYDGFVTMDSCGASYWAALTICQVANSQANKYCTAYHSDNWGWRVTLGAIPVHKGDTVCYSGCNVSGYRFCFQYYCDRDYD